MYQKIINFTPLEKLKSFLKKSKFLDSLTGFIKYHNAFAIGVSLIFVFTVGAFAASPDFRENFISSQETVRSVDNSYVLTADLDNFDFGLKITSITEDADNYYITYTYKTIAIEDYLWQEVEKENTLTVSKSVLGDRDLGLYVAEELGEIIDYELSYLKEVQQLEEQKGLTQKIITTQYAGLIGRFLSPKEKVFEGYQPVVQEPLAVQLKVGEAALPTCTPNWQCLDWQPLPETIACGQTFTQTRTCTDSNNCGADEGKPIESQEATGNLCSAQNTIGTCQSGSCNFTCADGFSNCDNDWSNGCEIASFTCPATE